MKNLPNHQKNSTKQDDKAERCEHDGQSLLGQHLCSYLYMRTSLVTWLHFQITRIWRDSKKKYVFILLEDDITLVQGSNSKKLIYL